MIAVKTKKLERDVVDYQKGKVFYCKHPKGINNYKGLPKKHTSAKQNKGSKNKQHPKNLTRSSSAMVKQNVTGTTIVVDHCYKTSAVGGDGESSSGYGCSLPSNKWDNPQSS